MRMTAPTKIMLIACGSFNPPTPMHFRLFEIARDHFNQMGTAEVVGGIVSPVHDSYGKKGLVSATHRCNMIKIGLQSSDWIRLSDWETQQEEWTRTRLTLQYHQNYINSYLKDSNNINDQQIPSWIPEGLNKMTGHVQLKLLCGADLLESFATPGLWKDEDIEAILGQHGLVVISRAGSNPEQFIFNSDLLSRYRRNITIVTNWVTNDVSSTLVRRLLGRGQSVKYLLDDYVTEYIKKHLLFGTSATKYTLTPNTGVEIMSISPVSPVNDNEVYVECQNQLNTLNSASVESMDETDFPRATLNRVFCCGTENDSKNSAKNMRGFLSAPGGAVQIITPTASTASSVTPDSGIGTVSYRTADEKVGEKEAEKKPLAQKHRISTVTIAKSEINSGSPVQTGASPATKQKASKPEESTGRVSPAKSYDDMIKFVFTEHGIKVISDREYVV
uniref:Nicotinamide-nucleotide adenylyltransferase n=1 Tax=Culex tarsalis TaxID=7177 RepID=A0A1Q3FV90_CULTA